MAKGRKTGGGSRKGRPNKVRPDAAVAVLQMLDEYGYDGAGKDGIRGAYRRMWENHPKQFLTGPATKVIATTLASDPEMPLQLALKPAELSDAELERIATGRRR